jgi:hypothetical protein
MKTRQYYVSETTNSTVSEIEIKGDLELILGTTIRPRRNSSATGSKPKPKKKA